MVSEKEAMLTGKRQSVFDCLLFFFTLPYRHIRKMDYIIIGVFCNKHKGYNQHERIRDT